MSNNMRGTIHPAATRYRVAVEQGRKQEELEQKSPDLKQCSEQQLLLHRDQLTTVKQEGSQKTMSQRKHTEHGTSKRSKTGN